MPKKCPDCRKCTENGIVGLTKKVTNTALIVGTFGTSAVGAKIIKSARGTCPICKHPMALHKNAMVTRNLDDDARRAENAKIQQARVIMASRKREQELQRADAILRAHRDGTLDELDARNGYPANWSTLRAAVMARDNDRCSNCGRHAKDVALEAHHIVPLTRGGTNNITNLTALCKDCHLRADRKRY